MFIYYLFVIYLFIFYLFHFYFYSYFFFLGGGSPPADLEGTWELTWPSVRHTCLIPKHLQTLLLSNFASCQQREYTGSTLSIRPSACLWTKSCLLCIFHNTSQIHFIFTHEINQLQNVSHTLRLFKNSKIGIIFFLLIPFLTIVRKNPMPCAKHLVVSQSTYKVGFFDCRFFPIA